MSDLAYSLRVEASITAARAAIGDGYRIGHMRVTYDSPSDTGGIWEFAVCTQCGAYSVMRSSGKESDARYHASGIAYKCAHLPYAEYLALPAERLSGTAPLVYAKHVFDSCVHVAVRGARSERQSVALARNLASRRYGTAVGHYVSSGAGPGEQACYVFADPRQA